MPHFLSFTHVRNCKRYKRVNTDNSEKNMALSEWNPIIFQWQPKNNRFSTTWPLGQGNVFTGVCDSVHGGYASVHAVIPTPEQTSPPRSRTPCKETPPKKEVPLPLPLGPHPRGKLRGIRSSSPPGTEHAGRYGQRAGDTHPTGM